MFVAGAPVEITVLAWSVVLLLVQIVLQTLALSKDCGLPYAMTPRDEPPSALGTGGKRLTRALANLLETYPAFVALALALVVTGKAGGIGATGAWVWLIARVVYVPVYALGIPALRTGVWTVSIVGLVMMLVKLFG